MEGMGHALGWRISKKAEQSSPARCPSALLPSPRSGSPRRTTHPCCPLLATSRIPLPAHIRIPLPQLGSLASSPRQRCHPLSQSPKPPDTHNHHGDEFGSAQPHLSRSCRCFPSFPPAPEAALTHAKAWGSGGGPPPTCPWGCTGWVLPVGTGTGDSDGDRDCLAERPAHGSESSTSAGEGNAPKPAGGGSANLPAPVPPSPGTAPAPMAGSWKGWDRLSPRPLGCLAAAQGAHSPRGGLCPNTPGQDPGQFPPNGAELGLSHTGWVPAVPSQPAPQVGLGVMAALPAPRPVTSWCQEP